MRRRTLLLGAVAATGLAACGSSLEEHSEEEWNQLLIQALEPLNHVAELVDIRYSLVKGPFSTDVWISGTVVSDTDDVAANEALLDDVGKTIITVHRNNPVVGKYFQGNSVKVEVLSPSEHRYRFLDYYPRSMTLEHLAEIHDVKRR